MQSLLGAPGGLAMEGSACTLRQCPAWGTCTSPPRCVSLVQPEPWASNGSLDLCFLAHLHQPRYASQVLKGSPLRVGLEAGGYRGGVRAVCGGGTGNT